MAEKLTDAAAMEAAQKHLGTDGQQAEGERPRGRRSPPPAGDNSQKAGTGATDGSDESLPRPLRIKQALQKVQELDDAIASAQAARTEFKNKVVKGGLGMKLSDFAAARRAVTLEGDERSGFLQTFREVYEASVGGTQLDWLAVAEQQP